MKKDELLAHNKQFITMAGDLLLILRGTDDSSCACCGAPQGVQHVAGYVCRALVEWRAVSNYGRPE